MKEEKITEKAWFWPVIIVAIVIIFGFGYRYTMMPIIKATQPLDEAMFPGEDITQQMCGMLLASQLEVENYTVTYNGDAKVCVVEFPNATIALLTKCKMENKQYSIIIKANINTTEEKINESIRKYAENMQGCEVTRI